MGYVCAVEVSQHSFINQDKFTLELAFEMRLVRICKYNSAVCRMPYLSLDSS